MEWRIELHDTIKSAAKKHDKRNDSYMTLAAGTCKPIRARVPPAAA
jgi:hypothetical protein